MVEGESKAAEGRADAKAAYAMERNAEKGAGGRCAVHGLRPDESGSSAEPRERGALP